MREKTRKNVEKSAKKHANPHFRDALCLNKKRAVFYSAKSRKNAPYSSYILSQQSKLRDIQQFLVPLQSVCQISCLVLEKRVPSINPKTGVKRFCSRILSLFVKLNQNYLVIQKETLDRDQASNLRVPVLLVFQGRSQLRIAVQHHSDINSALKQYQLSIWTYAKYLTYDKNHQILQNHDSRSKIQTWTTFRFT
ncbi:Hypothetical_protein [Hexamita inflata]|uniref:Hypothetical_protein n=1 Tax=Hexamita inflata TaxID=28002 RepID=A0ABP1K2E9_9EUKA